MAIVYANMYRLYPRGGTGLTCDGNGVALGEVELAKVSVTRGRLRCAVRPIEEIAFILELAYGDVRPETSGRVHRRLRRIAAHLEASELAHAEIEALMLGLPRLTQEAIAKLTSAGGLRKGNWWLDEPRIPAGQTGGGQWTTDSAGSVDAQSRPAAMRQDRSLPSTELEGRNRGLDTPEFESGAESSPHTGPSLSTPGLRAALVQTGNSDFDTNYLLNIGDPASDLRDNLPALGDLTDELIEFVSDAADKRELGRDGERAALKYFLSQGIIPLGEQIYVQTAHGFRIQDYLLEKGNMKFFAEIKVNSGRRTRFQIEKDADIENKGGTIASVLINIGGFTYGSKIPPMGVVVIHARRFPGWFEFTPEHHWTTVKIMKFGKVLLCDLG